MRSNAYRPRRPTPIESRRSYYRRRRRAGDAPRRRSSAGSSAVGSRTSSSDNDPPTDIWARALPLLVVAYLAARAQRPRPHPLERRRRTSPSRRSSSPSSSSPGWPPTGPRRRGVERPRRIGPAELAVFVVVPAVPSIISASGATRSQTVIRPSPCSPSCGRSPATACCRCCGGPAAHAGPARRAVQRRRPRPAAAAAVHDVPVHQRRGLAGRRHADGACTSSCSASSSSSARCSCCRGAVADARPEPLRDRGGGRRAGRRHACRRRALDGSRADAARPPTTGPPSASG